MLELSDQHKGSSTLPRSIAAGCMLAKVGMPDMRGVDLLVRKQAHRIFSLVVVMTAYADVLLAILIMKEGALDLLEKPFTDAAL
jgi:two-component system, LuxR family, response regulator FixJ